MRNAKQVKASFNNNLAPRVTRDTSLAELAGELSLHEETIRRHVRAGAPHARAGRRLMFNVGEYLRWMQASHLTGKRGRTSDAADSPELYAARVRKELALAAKYELQVVRERAGLVPVVHLRRWLDEHLSLARAALAGFGATVSPPMDGLDCAQRQELIDGRMREALEALSAGAAALAGGGTDHAPG